MLHQSVCQSPASLTHSHEQDPEVLLHLVQQLIPDREWAFHLFSLVSNLKMLSIIQPLYTPLTTDLVQADEAKSTTSFAKSIDLSKPFPLQTLAVPKNSVYKYYQKSLWLYLDISNILTTSKLKKE